MMMVIGLGLGLELGLGKTKTKTKTRQAHFKLVDKIPVTVAFLAVELRFRFLFGGGRVGFAASGPGYGSQGRGYIP